eukprot:10586649-Heterocapsa_arctica.AAC.1
MSGVVIVGPMRELRVRAFGGEGHFDPHGELEVKQQLDGGTIFARKPFQGSHVVGDNGVQTVVGTESVLL